MPAISVLWRWRQKDQEFKIIIGYRLAWLRELKKIDDESPDGLSFLTLALERL